jgi:hypothetical protein
MINYGIPPRVQLDAPRTPIGDACAACGRDVPEGFGHVCGDCLDKANLRINANVRLPKEGETLTLTIRYSDGQLVVGSPSKKKRLRWFWRR